MKGGSQAGRAANPGRFHSIGAVARATGLSPDLLRVWQKRYGFPVPRRKPSGHRLFSSVDVRRLRLIAEAVSRGLRPGRVVPMPEAKLREVLAEDGGQDEAFGLRPDPIALLLDHVKSHRRRELVAALLADAATLGPLSFLEERMAPLTDAVGDAWACGSAAVHQEHFYTECAEDVLRAVRLPFEREARGPGVIFATLPGELHGLGLQMATLAAAAAGLRPHLLGTATPVEEIADAWVTLNADAIGISVSLSTGGPSSRRQLARLRETIPATVPILLGGRGARRAHPTPGFAIVEGLRQISDVARTLRARAS